MGEGHLNKWWKGEMDVRMRRREGRKMEIRQT
jgi:hypothetical protein